MNSIEGSLSGLLWSESFLFTSMSPQLLQRGCQDGCDDSEVKEITDNYEEAKGPALFSFFGLDSWISKVYISGIKDRIIPEKCYCHFLETQNFDSLFLFSVHSCGLNLNVRRYSFIHSALYSSHSQIYMRLLLCICVFILRARRLIKCTCICTIPRIYRVINVLDIPLNIK